MPRELTTKGLATRSRIVEHAAAVARERGVAQTSLECVRASAKVSNSQLFHYFPDGKAALMLAVARHGADAILADQEARLGGANTWRAWEEWAEALCAHYESQGSRCDLTTLLSQLDPDNPGVQAILVDVFDTWERVLADAIRGMQAVRKIRPDLDADSTAQVVVAGIVGSTMHMAATGTTARLRTTMRATLTSLRG
ncbi:TetR/AcrR family transcriptional regulator [Umezawaea endophytica]|uniref:TetR/AcrR family transcriptional regulator n=1 Tax=Umezawaea endophytica TaxID=1654476 RepID=A0A9X2VR60_9PSEU|nr:TetR/AcrR family transcriptional regulator [Umezawaea endophytica]MCS7480667.1 TetR/AcrR family transcriptional regulator [Umezawaea endophytica]